MKAREQNSIKTREIYTAHVIVRCVRARRCQVMTQNQVAYWQLQEAKRSNLVREAETNRHNLEQERMARKIEDNSVQFRNNQTILQGIKVGSDIGLGLAKTVAEVI